MKYVGWKSGTVSCSYVEVTARAAAKGNELSRNGVHRGRRSTAVQTAFTLFVYCVPSGQLKPNPCEAKVVHRVRVRVD